MNGLKKANACLGHPAFWCVLIAFLLGYPHLFDPIWHDEAYTLSFFAFHPLQALTEYHKPNNHILFSFFFAAYRTLFGIGNNEVVLLRLFTVLPFVGSIVVFCQTLVRLRDRKAAWIGGLLFVTAHPVLNFAFELRGYGFSWFPIVCAWYVLVRYIATGRNLYVVLYGVFSCLAVAVLPTNLLLVVPFGISFVLALLFADRNIQWWKLSKQMTAIVLIPFLGLAMYYPVSDQIQKAMRLAEHDTIRQWLLHLPFATFIDFWWLAPLVLIGIYKFVNESNSERNTDFAIGLGFLLSFLLMPVLLVAASNPPVVRVMVPFFPLLYASIALLMPWSMLQTRYTNIAVVTICCMLIGFGMYRERIRSVHAATAADAGSSRQNLYDQYYQHHLNVEEVINRLRNMNENGGVAVLVGSTDPFTFFWHMEHTYDNDFPFPVVWAKRYRQKKGSFSAFPFGDRQVIIVAVSVREAKKVRSELDHPGTYTIQNVTRSGYYQMFRLKRKSD